MKTIFTDLVRLSESYNGRIPKEIPAHYVRFAYLEHKAFKKLNSHPITWRELRPEVIYL